VVALAVVMPDATLLVAGENWHWQTHAFDEYRVPVPCRQRPITMKTTDKTACVVGALTVHERTRSCSSPWGARWCART